MRDLAIKVRGALKIIWYFLVAIIPIVPLLIPGLVNNTTLTAIFTPAWILWVLKILYDQWDRFYFLVNRAWLWASNAEISWALSIELTGNITLETLDSIYNKVLTLEKQTITWRNEKHEKIVKLPIGCTARLRIVNLTVDADEVQEFFVFDISDLVVPFRYSYMALENLISLINETVISTVKPEQEKYIFKVKFGGINPYFGLFVRRFRVPHQKLVTFRVEFVENLGHKEELVDVSADRIALTTQSLTNLQTLSRRYITLASLDLTNP